jgi:energy-coupling factor transporter ATP-binding protein EcfA2
MKGPNPFVLWDQDTQNISGRKEEARIFNGFVNATSSKQPEIMLVTGGPGVGKTSLLKYFGHLARKNGVLAPYVKIEKGESMEMVLDKLHHEVRSWPGIAVTEKKAPSDFEGLLDSVSPEKKHFGIIFFMDDIDKMKKAPETVSEIEQAVKKSWGKKNISFVLSSVKDFRVSGLVKKMELKALEEHEAREVVEKALKKGPPKMGEECFNSIMNDTGGNPLLFKTVCHYIYERLRENEKVISKGHYLAYLPYIMSMLSREWFGRMFQETPAAEREILLVISKNEKGAHVSDVAKELDKPLGPVTALVKRLLERGQIVKIDRGKYKVFSRLYGKYVIQRS